MGDMEVSCDEGHSAGWPRKYLPANKEGSALGSRQVMQRSWGRKREQVVRRQGVMGTQRTTRWAKRCVFYSGSP